MGSRHPAGECGRISCPCSGPPERSAKLESQLAPLSDAATDARERALQDARSNPRLLRSGITAATIKPEDMEKLPRVLLPGHQEEPRVASICTLYIRTTRGEFSKATFTAFLRTLHDNDALTVFELWNLPGFFAFAF